MRRVLAALQGQTLAKEHWELLIIDNGSNEPLAGAWDLSWHPQTRCIREEELGLTPARLRGIAESAGDVVVFVDDDNVLDPNYLAEASRISMDWPRLGAWGGSIEAEYESAPDPWFHQYEQMIAIRPLKRDLWSNSYLWWDSHPCGAGLCVRRRVGLVYVEALQQSQARRSLDRKRDELSGSGDLDLAFCSIDTGLGVGRFTILKVLHLIPKFRCRIEYMEKLAEGTAESLVYLNSLREATRQPEPGRLTLLQRLRRWHIERQLNPEDVRMRHAKSRGMERAWKTLKESAAQRTLSTSTN